MISLVIVHYATGETLAQSLAAFALLHDRKACEIIVVDNGSLGSLAAPMQDLFPQARFIVNADNAGFGRAANQGAAAAKGEELLFLNGDCFLRPAQLREMDQVGRGLKKVGALGFRQVTPAGIPQLTFGQFPSLWSEWRRRRWQKALDVKQAAWAIRQIEFLGDQPFEVDWVSGSCLWVSRSVFEQVGGFDERFFMYFEDIDLCRRIRQLGLRIYHCPKPPVLHLHGASAAKNPHVAQAAYRQSQLYFAQKHKGAMGVLATRIYQQVRKIISS